MTTLKKFKMPIGILSFDETTSLLTHVALALMGKVRLVNLTFTLQNPIRKVTGRLELCALDRIKDFLENRIRRFRQEELPDDELEAEIRKALLKARMADELMCHYPTLKARSYAISLLLTNVFRGPLVSVV